MMMNIGDFSEYGDGYQFANWYIFFGNKDLNLEEIQKKINAKICLLQQVHGDQLVYANNDSQQIADAQWTAEKSHLLVIKTADCLPVMIMNSHTRTSIAIHAGWKGLEKQIVKKTLQRLSPNAATTKVFVGPHILYESFQVQEDVARNLMSSHQIPCEELELYFPEDPKLALFLKQSQLTKEDLIAKKNNHYYINLFALCQWQLFQYGIPLSQIEFLQRNTVTDPRYCSYRRDKDKYKAGTLRNYSFITSFNF